jgi:hypothetical protein
LSRLLASFGEQAVAVNALANPLRLMSGSGRTVILFDYAYFLFLHGLCRALSVGGDTAGSLLALYHFEIGSGLDRIGLRQEAAGLLRSACELRSSFAVYPVSMINEAMLYQLAANVCITHERAHQLFVDDPAAKEDWSEQARVLLLSLQTNLGLMYADDSIRKDLHATIVTFLANDTLLEEVACDICAIDHCIEHAILQHPDSGEQYCNAYYATMRLNMLAIYSVRNLAIAAELVIREIREGRLESVASPDRENDLSFMSALRLRFQILLSKVGSLKVRYGLIPVGSGFRATADVLQTDEQKFERLAAGLMTELHEARRSIAIHRQLWIGHASRLFFPDAGEPDNLPLMALFLRQFWFAPMDLEPDD